MLNKCIGNTDTLHLITGDSAVIKCLQNGTAESALADIFLNGNDARMFFSQGANEFDVQRLYKPAVNNRCGYTQLGQFRLPQEL